jgi:GT2 family glycosyltransferase
VWVVDNGSTAGDGDIVSRRFPAVKLLRSPANLGFSQANNLVLRRASSRYFLLVNNDVLVPPDALRCAVQFMDAHPEVAVAGASLVDVDGRAQPSSGDILTPLRALAEELHVNTLLRRWLTSRRARHPDAGRTRTWEPVGYVSGAFFMIRRKSVEQIGILDERFEFYCEEMDWCARAAANGWEIALLTDLVVTHHHGGTTAADPPRFQAMLAESRFRFLRKHYGRTAAALLRASAAAGAIALLVRWALPLGRDQRRPGRLAVAACRLCWALGIEKPHLGQRRCTDTAGRPS